MWVIGEAIDYSFPLQTPTTSHAPSTYALSDNGDRLFVALLQGVQRHYSSCTWPFHRRKLYKQREEEWSDAALKCPSPVWPPARLPSITYITLSLFGYKNQRTSAEWKTALPGERGKQSPPNERNKTDAAPSWVFLSRAFGTHRFQGVAVHKTVLIDFSVQDFRWLAHLENVCEWWERKKGSKKARDGFLKTSVPTANR